MCAPAKDRTNLQKVKRTSFVVLPANCLVDLQGSLVE